MNLLVFLPSSYTSLATFLAVDKKTLGHSCSHHSNLDTQLIPLWLSLLVCHMGSRHLFKRSYWWCCEKQMSSGGHLWGDIRQAVVKQHGMQSGVPRPVCIVESLGTFENCSSADVSGRLPLSECLLSWFSNFKSFGMVSVLVFIVCLFFETRSVLELAM